jgi:predicted nucleic acid-binding protein
LERIAEAEQIAAEYNQNNIVCCISDEPWTECIKKDHAIQVQTQLSVLQLQFCVYIVAQAGSRDCSGRIINPETVTTAVQKRNQHSLRFDGHFLTS